MKMNAKRMTTNAVLIALYVVLSFVSLNFFDLFKLSFALLPIFVSALCFGAADAMIVGALGRFVFEMYMYGFSVMTFVWMAAPVALGALAGWYAQKKGFALTLGQNALIIVLGCVLVTTLNSIGLYINGKVYGINTVLTLSTIALRYVSCIVMSVIYTIVVPRVVKLLRRSGVTGGR